ncbi:MAG: IS5 family transposase [Salinispira sp.]
MGNNWKEHHGSLINQGIQESKALKRFDSLYELINWKEIGDMLCAINNNSMGAKGYHPVMMFKVLLLQSWQNLSDEGMENALACDLAYKRFVGLNVLDDTPDHSTIWRFREQLTRKNILSALLDTVNAQLDKQDCEVHRGAVSIIDASVIQASRHRKKKNDAGESTQDPEAAYASKRGGDGTVRTTYGFKIHVTVNEKGRAKKLLVTAANIHDSKLFGELIMGNETVVYADAAYRSKAIAAMLEEMGIENQIHERAYRNTPLTDEQKQANYGRSRVRNTVERFFGLSKLHCGARKARYMGVQRNQSRFMCMAIMYNLKQMIGMKRRMMNMAPERSGVAA